jgi:hypothetical protein
VRQLVTWVLLVLFTAPSVPVATQAADADTKLPACCRRDGKHGCGMAMQKKRDGGVAVRPAKVPCASFPAHDASPAANRFGVAEPAANLAAAPPVTGINAIAQTEALYRTSFSRTRQKRGPPLVS